MNIFFFNFRSENRNCKYLGMTIQTKNLVNIWAKYDELPSTQNSPFQFHFNSLTACSELIRKECTGFLYAAVWNGLFLFFIIIYIHTHKVHIRQVQTQKLFSVQKTAQNQKIYCAIYIHIFILWMKNIACDVPLCNFLISFFCPRFSLIFWCCTQENNVFSLFKVVFFTANITAHEQIKINIA